MVLSDPSNNMTKMKTELDGKLGREQAAFKEQSFAWISHND